MVVQLLHHRKGGKSKSPGNAKCPVAYDVFHDRQKSTHIAPFNGDSVNGCWCRNLLPRLMQFDLVLKAFRGQDDADPCGMGRSLSVMALPPSPPD